MASKEKKAALWAEAQRKCRLSGEALRMAKEMGIGPRSLIKNIPNKSQAWKAPVEDWVRDLYRERKEKAARKARLKGENQGQHPTADLGVDLEVEGLTREAGTAKGYTGEGEFLGEDDSADVEEDIPWDFETEFSSDDEEDPPSRRDIREENEAMLRRQREFQLAAEYVAGAFRKHPSVLRVALIGSAASPLNKEIPRFRQFRRAGVSIWHECRDVDLAVWLDDLDCLNELRKALGRALNELLSDHQIGVAHHQVDVFILEPGTDRYRGRLCRFGSCPKQGKDECYVSGCGVRPFLRQHRDFTFHLDSLIPDRMVILWDRQGHATEPPEADSGETSDDDDIPF